MRQGVMMSVFDILCPCHAKLSPTGHILHLGPTLAKVLGEARHAIVLQIKTDNIHIIVNSLVYIQQPVVP